MSRYINIKDSVGIRCALVTINPFPIGNVATMRYSSYMQALAGVVSLAKVYIFSPSRTAKPNKSISGVHNGVHYEYTSGKIYLENRNFFSMAYFLIVGLLRCWRSINNDGINALILYGENPWLVNAFFKILCSVKRIGFYADRSEYPDVAVRKSVIRQWWYRYKIKWFDGMILMTDELKCFYTKWMKKEAKAFLLPMTIDCTRFDKVKSSKDLKDKFIAVVFGTHNRDGLLESLKAYKRYRQLGGTYSLHLIGNYMGMPNKEDLDVLTQDPAVSDYIQICGLIQNDQIPQKLTEASCLMTTPNSYPSGGFPTKVGEYMLSGVPVVATSAGVLLKYIEPEKEMLFSDPGDIQAIAENLLRIEKDPLLGASIAEQARNKVVNVFNADVYLNKLCDFLSGRL